MEDESTRRSPDDSRKHALGAPGGTDEDVEFESLTRGREPESASRATAGLAGGTVGWYIERVWAVMRLDLLSPELQDSRRIVATENGLTELMLSMSVPRPPDAPISPRDLGMDVVFGGRIVRVDRRGDTIFSAVLRLPRPLKTGERHDIGCVWQLPPGQPMTPRYAMSPTIRCDALDLRVRFPRDADPRVERLDGLPIRAVEDLTLDLPVVPLDGAAEASAHFDHLALGLSYGLRWT
ncbi:hypothetical protein I6A84_04510 [Frankia sp. CNm7]|uniref:Uncharacterized protein n=1 Tax=Frankia nepalensis TaxID=1836974 RepID=A0A937RAN2_9ACTN|nr:hypothetical protein [Frankia nepalensis]MBL7498733.1 hypothetical protein [Frankia nepalensis]MBL7508402.1 hypothetical protein [Frankia nepalensis]MBL7517402.1 hypothetical protein [Frankia nepalensis]MBL7626232.1 hypothetical protein [Frankia nepalensis]